MTTNRRMAFVFCFLAVAGITGGQGLAYAAADEADWVRTTRVTISVETGEVKAADEPVVTSDSVREAAEPSATARPGISPRSAEPTNAGSTTPEPSPDRSAEDAEPAESISPTPEPVESPSDPAPTGRQDVEPAEQDQR
jgi:hypothetical protein